MQRPHHVHPGGWGRRRAGEPPAQRVIVDEVEDARPGADVQGTVERHGVASRRGPVEDDSRLDPDLLLAVEHRVAAARQPEGQAEPGAEARAVADGATEQRGHIRLQQQPRVTHRRARELLGRSTGDAVRTLHRQEVDGQPEADVHGSSDPPRCDQLRTQQVRHHAAVRSSIVRLDGLQAERIALVSEPGAEGPAAMREDRRRRHVQDPRPGDGRLHLLDLHPGRLPVRRSAHHQHTEADDGGCPSKTTLSSLPHPRSLPSPLASDPHAPACFTSRSPDHDVRPGRGLDRSIVPLGERGHASHGTAS